MDNFSQLVKLESLPFEMPLPAQQSHHEISIIFGYISSFDAPDVIFAKLRNFFGQIGENDVFKYIVLGLKECFEVKKLELIFKLQENRFISITNLKSKYANAQLEHDFLIIFAFEELNLHFKNCAIINLAIKDWQIKLMEVLSARRQQNSKS